MAGMEGMSESKYCKDGLYWIPLVVHLILFSQISFSSHCCNNQSHMGFDQLHSDAISLWGFAIDCSTCLGFSDAVAQDTYRIPLRTPK